MDIRDYLAAWRAQWVIIVACVVLALGVAAGVSALMTPKYVATTRLFTTTTGGASVSEAYQGNLFSTNRVTSYAGLATGKQVAQRAVDELGLRASAEDVMSRVSAEPVPDSVLLDITVTDTNPGLARDLANVVASQTSSLVQELETSARGGVPAASATIVDLADLPTSPSSPSWVRNLGLGLVGGLILGLVAAVIRWKLDRSVRTADDIAAAVGGPVLGSIPPAEGTRDETGSVDAAPTPVVTEPFREIRTNLLAMDHDGSLRTVVVTGPRVGAGATTVAVGLSVAVAETGRSVVLLDADFGRGSVAAAFGAEAGPGLVDFLRGNEDLDAVVVPTAVDNLSIVGTGAADASSSGLIGGTRMADLIKQLHGDFDIVVVDGPAVSTSSDSAVLAALADGAVLVARRGSTSAPELRGTVSKITLARGRVIGAVATSARRRRLLR